MNCRLFAFFVIVAQYRFNSLLHANRLDRISVWNFCFLFRFFFLLILQTCRICSITFLNYAPVKWKWFVIFVFNLTSLWGYYSAFKVAAMIQWGQRSHNSFTLLIQIFDENVSQYWRRYEPLRIENWSYGRVSLKSFNTLHSV